jgi:hypothetical protein
MSIKKRLSYLSEEDLREITKDWSAEILIPADPA